MNHKKGSAPVGRDEMAVTAGQTNIILTTLAHPVAELDDGAANVYLVQTVESTARSVGWADSGWMYVGERRTADGWDQVWLPCERPQT